jgi:hypothetical protein
MKAIFSMLKIQVQWHANMIDVYIHTLYDLAKNLLKQHGSADGSGRFNLHLWTYWILLWQWTFHDLYGLNGWFSAL